MGVTANNSLKVNAMLKHKIAIYVPSTVKGSQPAPQTLIDKWVKASKIMLASLFGGFTTYSAQGGWFSTEHGLIEETVQIVVAFTDDNGLKNLSQVQELAQQMAVDMAQEAVSVEVDGILNFVTTEVSEDETLSFAA
jgi:hypothetical protein